MVKKQWVTQQWMQANSSASLIMCCTMCNKIEQINPNMSVVELCRIIRRFRDRHIKCKGENL